MTYIANYLSCQRGVESQEGLKPSTSFPFKYIVFLYVESQEGLKRAFFVGAYIHKATINVESQEGLKLSLRIRLFDQLLSYGQNFMGLSAGERNCRSNAAWRGRDSEARGVWLWLGFPMRCYTFLCL